MNTDALLGQGLPVGSALEGRSNCLKYTYYDSVSVQLRLCLQEPPLLFPWRDPNQNMLQGNGSLPWSEILNNLLGVTTRSPLNSSSTDFSDIIETLKNSFHCNGSATFEQLLRYVDISWWLDGVFQTAIATFGILINVLALPILFSKRMKSVFNCLLTILLAMETLFILSTCFETFRQNLNLQTSYLSNALFAFLIYPLKNGILYYSIYMATVMARERYIAVRCPIKYHNETAGLNPWRRAFVLSLPVFLFSSVFIIPIFFEAKLEAKVLLVEKSEYSDIQKMDNGINVAAEQQFNQRPPEYPDTPDLVNMTVHELHPSDLRFNEVYVLYYKNIATFVLTMIFPFTLLIFYNCRKSYVLFAITFFIIVCNSVRFLLGLHECISVDSYQDGVRNHCNPSPLWVLIMQSVSNLLLTLNSSLCSVLYCLTSRDFQNELRTHYAWFKEQVSPSSENPPGVDEQGADTGTNMLIPLSLLEDAISADRHHVLLPQMQRTRHQRSLLLRKGPSVHKYRRPTEEPSLQEPTPPADVQSSQDVDCLNHPNHNFGRKRRYWSVRDFESRYKGQGTSSLQQDSCQHWSSLSGSFSLNDAGSLTSTTSLEATPVSGQAPLCLPQPQTSLAITYATNGSNGDSMTTLSLYKQLLHSSSTDMTHSHPEEEDEVGDLNSGFSSRV